MLPCQLLVFLTSERNSSVWSGVIWTADIFKQNRWNIFVFFFVCLFASLDLLLNPVSNQPTLRREENKNDYSYAWLGVHALQSNLMRCCALLEGNDWSVKRKKRWKEWLVVRVFLVWWNIPRFKIINTQNINLHLMKGPRVVLATLVHSEKSLKVIFNE